MSDTPTPVTLLILKLAITVPPRTFCTDREQSPDSGHLHSHSALGTHVVLFSARVGELCPAVDRSAETRQLRPGWRCMNGYI